MQNYEIIFISIFLELFKVLKVIVLNVIQKRKKQSCTMMKDLLSLVLVFLSIQNYVIELTCQLIYEIVKMGAKIVHCIVR